MHVRTTLYPPLPNLFFLSNKPQAITAMVRQLRQPGRPHNGLILANGGVVTYQHVIILSSSPRRDGTPYPARDPLPPVLTPDSTPSVDAQAEGEAVIEVRALQQTDTVPMKSVIRPRCYTKSLTSSGSFTDVYA